MSRKATFVFIPCCFVSGAKISSFYEFYLFLIAVFLSHCVGSLCPSSVFFLIWNTFLKRCLRLKASPLFCLKCVYTSRIAFCFVSGAKISSFYEFYLFLIAVFLSHCVGSLCPSSVFFLIWNTFLKRCLRLKASPLFCLKCVYTSRIAFSLNLVPL